MFSQKIRHVARSSGFIRWISIWFDADIDIDIINPISHWLKLSIPYLISGYYQSYILFVDIMNPISYWFILHGQP